MRSTGAVQEILIEEGININQAPKPGGTYHSVVLRGNIAFVAIQFPIKNDEYLFLGRLGDNLQTADGYGAARLCAINVYLQIGRYIGLDNLEGLNHFDLYYQGIEGWDEAPKVANGASDFFNQALGSLGTHTRAIIGAYSLPRNFCVGICASFTVKARPAAV